LGRKYPKYLRIDDIYISTNLRYFGLGKGMKTTKVILGPKPRVNKNPDMIFYSFELDLSE